VDDEDDFVMSHLFSLWAVGLPECEAGEARMFSDVVAALPENATDFRQAYDYA
jgi:hypothetical protein